MTRGIIQDVDTFIDALKNKWLPFTVHKDKRTMPDVEHELMAGNHQVQLSVRPIQLWEIVYPKEQRDLVLNTIFKGHDGSMQHKKHNKFVAVLRKMLGARKPGDYGKTMMLPMKDHAIERVFIGEKDDYEFCLINLLPASMSPIGSPVLVSSQPVPAAACVFTPALPVP